MKAAAIVVQVDAEEARNAAVRDARARVDAARALHERLRREVDALQRNPKRNQLALERFGQELEQARSALRQANRELIRRLSC